MSQAITKSYTNLLIKKEVIDVIIRHLYKFVSNRSF